MNDNSSALKYAERGAILSIITYCLFAITKLYIGYTGHSEALLADGWNNFTDILSNIFVLIGLKFARVPSDREHQYGHWKMEHIASLLMSFIMFCIGLSVLINPIKSLFTHETKQPDLLSGIVGVITGIIMFCVYRYNSKLAKQSGSYALLAAAKDNLSDMYSSFGAGIAALSGITGWHLLDNLTAIIIGLIILKNAIEIFRQSAFILSDGFDEKLLTKYTHEILQIPGIDGVKKIRGRSYGNLIYLDVDIYMDPNMTVKHSHDLTELIEQNLAEKYDVSHTEIHVEPTPKEEN